MEIKKIKSLLLGVGVSVGNAEKYSILLDKHWQENGIIEDSKQIYFLANCLSETGNFKSLEENLNYSAERLTKVFPSLFKTVEFAKKYERNPEVLANYIYDSRVRKNTMKNNFDGAGWLYRGRGLFQTTWLSNYEVLKYATGIDVVKNPDLLLDPDMAVKSACVFWRTNNMNNLTSLKEVRRKIAGSYFGYDDHVLPNFNKLMAVYNKG